MDRPDQNTDRVAVDRSIIEGPDPDALPPPLPFPLLSLPAELTLEIASFLPPRSLLALLLTSPAFAHISSLINALSRQEHTIREGHQVHVYTPLQFFSSRGIESIVRRLLLEGADPNAVSHGDPQHPLSPLTHAINFHSASIVSLLLQHGATAGHTATASPH